MELRSVAKVHHLFLNFTAILESSVVLSVLKSWSLNVLCGMWHVEKFQNLR